MIKILDDLGSALVFLNDIIKTIFKTPPDSKSVSEQIYNVTTQSLTTTVSSGFFVGAILSVQFNAQLKQFDTLSVLGGLSTSGTIRELGPLLIAFMLSGKVGAYTSAELGTMRVTEQIDAMRCLGTNPMQYLIAPRFVGIIISSFFLLLAGLLMSILGGAILATVVADMNMVEYINSIPTYVKWSSVYSGLFKCFMFSLLIATICTYKGYATTGGSKGVGRSVVATALSTMVGLTLLDWFTSFLVENLFKAWGL
ncbi:MAG: ABC transporter permease [Oligoflexia bacterium]|nr:ABC transporter permease [Oligoflexia bacterium]